MNIQNSSNSQVTLEQRNLTQRRALSRQWIKMNRGKYRGRWVVLKGDRLLIDAASSREIREFITSSKEQEVLITVVY